MSWQMLREKGVRWDDAPRTFMLWRDCAPLREWAERHIELDAEGRGETGWLSLKGMMAHAESVMGTPGIDYRTFLQAKAMRDGVERLMPVVTPFSALEYSDTGGE